MHLTKLLPATVLLLTLSGVAACGSDAPKGDKAAFCRTSTDIDKATAGIDSQEKAKSLFTGVLPKMDKALDQAPDEVRADTKKLVDAAHAAVKSGDFGAFEDGSLDAANGHIAKFCN